MNTDEIQNRIYELVGKLDLLYPIWAKSKADHNYATEMKNVTLNMEKAKSEAKSVAGREEDAYKSEAYKNYLYKVFEVDCEYYKWDGQKSLYERELEAMRSLLSFNKNQINRTI